MNIRPALVTGGSLALGVLALGAVQSGLPLAMTPGRGTPSAGWAPMPDPAGGGVASPPLPANLTAEERAHLETFDALDFEVFTNHDWARLAESHAPNIRVHFPDGHYADGIDKHIADMGGHRTAAVRVGTKGSVTTRRGRPIVGARRCVVNVLVAYATKNGSTQQVADAIAAALRGHGAQVALVPARAVREPVAGYDLVVLGAPLYSGRWHRDARGFLRRHRRELSGAAVAVFGMGPRDDTQEAWRRSRAQLDRALVKLGWLDPIAVTVFGGVDPPGRSKGPRRDLRNWDTIQAWTTKALAAAGGIRQGDTTADH